MDLTEQFFIHMHKDLAWIASKKSQRIDPSPFHVAANQIIAAIKNSMETMVEISDDFIDSECTVISKKSTMAETERTEWLNEFHHQLQEFRNQAATLFQTMQKGSISESEKQASAQVFKTIEFYVQQFNEKLRFMVQRRQETLNIVQQAMNQGKVRSTIHAIPQDNNIDTPIDPSFAQSLKRRHDIITDLTQTSQQLNSVETVLSEIQAMHVLFNELLEEQNMKIDMIKDNLDEAHDNYESALPQIDKARERAKFQHLWMSLVMFLLGLNLIYCGIYK